MGCGHGDEGAEEGEDDAEKMEMGGLRGGGGGVMGGGKDEVAGGEGGGWFAVEIGSTASTSGSLGSFGAGLTSSI